jgi:hypothetical protein
MDQPNNSLYAKIVAQTQSSNGSQPSGATTKYPASIRDAQLQTEAEEAALEAESEQLAYESAAAYATAAEDLVVQAQRLYDAEIPPALRVPEGLPALSTDEADRQEEQLRHEARIANLSNVAQALRGQANAMSPAALAAQRKQKRADLVVMVADVARSETRAMISAGRGPAVAFALVKERMTDKYTAPVAEEAMGAALNQKWLAGEHVGSPVRGQEMNSL